jgi:hypothetical protein
MPHHKSHDGDSAALLPVQDAKLIHESDDEESSSRERGLPLSWDYKDSKRDPSVAFCDVEQSRLIEGCINWMAVLALGLTGFVMFCVWVAAPPDAFAIPQQHGIAVVCILAIILFLYAIVVRPLRILIRRANKPDVELDCNTIHRFPLIRYVLFVFIVLTGVVFLTRAMVDVHFMDAPSKKEMLQPMIAAQ